MIYVDTRILMRNLLKQAVALESEVRFYTGVDSLIAVTSKIGWHLSSRIAVNALKQDAKEEVQVKTL